MHFKKKIKKIICLFIVGILIILGVVIILSSNNVKTTAIVKNEGNMQNMWVGTFQLAWNEFIEQVIKGDVEFEKETPEIVKTLNQKQFTKDMLSEDSYYVKSGETSESLRNGIMSDLNNKFEINNSDILNLMVSNNISRSYTIYATLNKEFAFLTPFDKLMGNTKFANGEKNIQYFGINNATSENVNKNVDVLFYNSDSDYAVTLNTKENDEVILYKVNADNTFEILYNEIKEKEEQYKGNRQLKEIDELKVPYINIEDVVNYNELCGQEIKGTNGMYIANAIQNIKFSLNEKGGNLNSEAGLKSIYTSLLEEKPRYFFFNDKFVLFLKEKDKPKPYFAVKIYDENLLTEYAIEEI